MKIIQRGKNQRKDREQTDEIFAFFGACFHLKNWIKEENEELGRKAEALFDKKKGKEYMKVCADLVNGTKHVRASHTTRIDENTSVQRQHVTVHVPTLKLSINQTEQQPPTPPASSSYGWEVKAGKSYYNVFDLADKCFTEWKSFFRGNGLTGRKRHST